MKFKMSEEKKIVNQRVLKDNCSGIQVAVEVIVNKDGSVLFVVRQPNGQPFLTCSSGFELADFFDDAADCLQVTPTE